MSCILPLIVYHPLWFHFSADEAGAKFVYYQTLPPATYVFDTLVTGVVLPGKTGSPPARGLGNQTTPGSLGGQLITTMIGNMSKIPAIPTYCPIVLLGTRSNTYCQHVAPLLDGGEYNNPYLHRFCLYLYFCGETEPINNLLFGFLQYRYCTDCICFCIDGEEVDVRLPILFYIDCICVFISTNIVYR